MASFGILRRVTFERTDVSEEINVSFIRVTRIDEVGTTLALTSNRHTLRRYTKEALSSFETSVLTRATRRNIPKDAILHSHRRGNFKSYISSIISRFCSELISYQIILFKILNIFSTSVLAWVQRPYSDNLVLISACLTFSPSRFPFEHKRDGILQVRTENIRIRDNVRFEVLTALTMKNIVFLDAIHYGCSKN
jgi:hypothetical protein